MYIENREKIIKNILKRISKFTYLSFLLSPFIILDTSAALFYNSSSKNLEQKVIIKNEKLAQLHQIKLGKILQTKYEKDKTLTDKVKHDICRIFPQYKNTIDNLFNDQRFEIYNISNRKKNYDAVPDDFYFRPEFGFFTERGFNKALTFIHKNNRSIDEAMFRFKLRAEKAKETMVALSGIESDYGNFFGNYKLFNSLISMYVYVDKRFALQNLEALFKAMKNPLIKINPFCKSSFMGAIGLPQMMPMWLSKMNNEHDLDNDGVFNPFSVDGMAFIAWYLARSGANQNMKKAVGYYNPQKAFVKVVTVFADSLYKLDESNTLLLTYQEEENPWALNEHPYQH